MSEEKVQVNIEMPLAVKKQLYIEAILQDIPAKKLAIEYIKRGLRGDFEKRGNKGLGF